jgi:hypothetical protein
VFGFVFWDHISDDCEKKMDEKSHAFSMMGYSKESKFYRLFDPVKHKIIIRRNVWFDEKLLHDSSGLLQDDHFDVVFDSGSTVPFFKPLTGQLNYVPILTRLSTFKTINALISISTGPPYLSNEIVSTSDRPIVVNNHSPIFCLPRWVSKTIEVSRPDVGDVSFG